MNNALSPFSELTDTISKRRTDALRRRENKALLRSTLSTAAFIAVVIALFCLIFGFKIVKGNDMFPSLCDGDLALCFKVKELTKNDIVFYEADGETHCGRVVAKGGDRITIKTGGVITVNGTVQENEIIYPTYPREETDYSAVVPDGTVFVLGDFRTEAKDSRDYGFIEVKEIDKKVIALLRHRKF